MMSHAKPPAIHAEKAANRALYPDPSDRFWQPLIELNGEVILPAPGILSASVVSRIRSGAVGNATLIEPSGAKPRRLRRLTFGSYGNNATRVYAFQYGLAAAQAQGKPRYRVVIHRVGRVTNEVTVRPGTDVPAFLPGKVVRGFRHWTPGLGIPGGDQVIVRTIFPDGSRVSTTYRHLDAHRDASLQPGDPVLAGQTIGEVARTGAIPPGQPARLTIVARELSRGEKTLAFFGTPQLAFSPSSPEPFVPQPIGSPAPPTAGACSPSFIDTDKPAGGGSDDPDKDADDPGGICGPTSPSTIQASGALLRPHSRILSRSTRRSDA